MLTQQRFGRWVLIMTVWITVVGAFLHPMTAQADTSVTLAASIGSAAVEAESAAPARAIFFYSPTCGHCHFVMTEILPPLAAQYGDQLQIVAVDVSQSSGEVLYQAAVEHYAITADRFGVPTMLIGDSVLVGSTEIPNQFPKLVASALDAGGIDWPDSPGIAVLTANTAGLKADRSGLMEPGGIQIARAASSAMDVSAEVPVEETAASLSTAPVLSSAEWTAAGSVAIGMLLAILYGIWRLGRYQPPQKTKRRTLKRLRHGRFAFHGSDFAPVSSWILPLLAFLGAAIAVYLSYIEITHASAVCGPLGDCQTVQTSAYARLWGIVPIAVVGLGAYVAIVALWFGQRFLRNRLGDSGTNAAIWGLLALVLAGTLFSIYLTYLELFVIRAICLWCLSSALVMTAMLIYVVLAVTSGPSGVSLNTARPAGRSTR